MTTPEERLADAGIELPTAPAPAAAYVPSVRTLDLVYTAGQLPLADGELLAVGKVGAEVDLETAQAAARQCALNALAVVRDAVTELSNVKRVVKLTVFVASDPSFSQQHLVANGASELMVTAFGEDVGRHARSAVAAPVLPMDAAVEVEAIVEVG